MADDVIKLDKKRLSQLDLGGVIRSVHDDPSQTLRVINGISEVPSSYSRVNLTYNSKGSVTQAIFYEGILAQKTEIVPVADVSGSLNNTYITLYSENDESQYHMWFNVSGGGTDPAPLGSVGIEIPIQTNDSATVIAGIIETVFKYIKDFCATRCGTRLIVENSRKGKSSPIVDVNSGFSVTTLSTGAEHLVKSIDIPYDGMTKYLYNTQDKRFEVSSAVDVTVSVDDKDPNDWEILNVSIPLKNIETSIVLPSTTKSFLIKEEDAKGPIRIARNATETSNLYWTLYRGAEFSSNKLDLSASKTIYLLSEQDSVNLQIFIWKQV